MTEFHPYQTLVDQGVITQNVMRYHDKGIVRASEIVKPLASQAQHHVEYLLLGLPLSKSSISHSGASFTPDTIRHMLSSYTTYSVHTDVDLSSIRLFDAGNVGMHVTDIEESQRRIRKAASAVLGSYEPNCTFFLGGDHSVTCPLVQGIYDSFLLKRDKDRRIGIIQFDAHHDLRFRDQGGPSNGTPFRGLLESESIQGNELIQLGIRDFSNGKTYTEYAHQQNISLYTMQDIEQNGIIHCLSNALQHLKNQGIDWIYVSLDMDVMDQAFAPGCPAIGPGGMDTRELLHAIRYLAKQNEVKALDIVEIDPTLDVRDMTSRLAAQVLLHFLASRIQHHSA